jgi:MNLL subunit.
MVGVSVLGEDSKVCNFVLFVSAGRQTMPPPKHNLFGFRLKHWQYIIPLVGLAFGKMYTDLEAERKTRFRDKSLLYGSKNIETPSWPANKWWPRISQ